MFYKTLFEKEDKLSYGIMKENIITKKILILTGEKKDNIKSNRKYYKQI